MLPSPPASPLRGTYLVRNRLLNGLLRLVDGVLNRVGPRRHPVAYATRLARRILLANGAHLGDVLLASAVVPLLKDALPGCEIGFLVGRWALPVLENQPAVDHVHVVDHWRLNRGTLPLVRKVRRYLDTRRRALREMRRLRYEVAIDLYPYFPNSIPLLWQAGIPVRVGYTSGGFGPLLTHALQWQDRPWHVTEYHAELLGVLLSRGEVERRMALLKPLAPARPSPPTPLPEYRARGETMSAAMRAPLSEGYLVLHMGTGAVCKEWPRERWRRLAEQLLAAGHSLVFTGASATEQHNIRQVTNGLPRCVDLCGQLNWGEFGDVVRHARLLIGVDSVAGHVAAAVGTPCVVIASGIPNPMHWRPRGRAGCRVLTHPVPCAPCYRSHGCEGMECVRQVEVAEVLAAVPELLLPTPSAIPA